jgi:hypothetical protein
MNGTPGLTAESVRGLPTETKQQLLALLARDLLASSGAPLSVRDEAGGEIHVYRVPPDARARAERAMREASPEYLAELRRRAATPEQSMSLEEVLQIGKEPGAGQ